MIDSPIIVWLQERLDNCLRIAKLKDGSDREEWLNDARYFSMAIGTIRGLEARLMEAPPDALWVVDEKGERQLMRYIGPTIEELRAERKKNSAVRP